MKYDRDDNVDWETDGWTVGPPEPYCGVYWIITTCWIAIAIGAGFGGLLWLVLGGRA